MTIFPTGLEEVESCTTTRGNTYLLCYVDYKEVFKELPCVDLASRSLPWRSVDKAVQLV